MSNKTPANTTPTTFDFPTIIPKFDAILARGLCNGVGERDGQMCIEAAICAVLDLPHKDDPQCVTNEIRRYKIRLNDSRWSSPQARAEGLRDLGIAQIGSKGVVDGKEFAKRLAEQTIRVLLPTLIRTVERFAGNKKLLAAADVCEQEGTGEAAIKLRDAAYAADAADAAAYAAYAADAADAAAYAAYAADAAAYAAYAADAADTAAYAAYAANRFLRLSASLALQILIDLKSPGAAWVADDAVQKLRA